MKRLKRAWSTRSSISCSSSSRPSITLELRSRFRVSLKTYSPSSGNVCREWHALPHPGVLTGAMAADWNLVVVRSGPIVRTGEGDATDVRGRGHVAGHQSRRDGKRVGIVVETEPGHIAWQQVRPVDFQ